MRVCVAAGREEDEQTEKDGIAGENGREKKKEDDNFVFFAFLRVNFAPAGEYGEKMVAGVLCFLCVGWESCRESGRARRKECRERSVGREERE